MRIFWPEIEHTWTCFEGISGGAGSLKANEFNDIRIGTRVLSCYRRKGWVLCRRTYFC
jgi:hypothetical protein